jgi:trk system potassium uptake protein TrkA
MNIVICGAGQVGSHAADVLAAAGHNITVIDLSADRARAIEDSLDVRVLNGNCATAEALAQAGCSDADLVVAATENDETNLITASIASGLGAAKTVCRVHHATYFEQRGLDYGAHFSVDCFICPEYSTSLAIARILRNPGAIAIENFARGQIEMHEFPVTENAAAVGVALSKLGLPAGTRLAAITRDRHMFIPDGASVVETGDTIVLVGNTSAFQQARKLFHNRESGRRRVVIMGGPSMALWLCRALRERDFSIRLFEIRRNRAEELAEELSWVTVLQGDPTERSLFDEEKIGQADAFVALLDDDEHNILGCAWAKSMGVRQVVAVVQRPDYIHLLGAVGIDRAFSPRMVAVKEIERFMESGLLRRMASLAEGEIDVYWCHVGEQARMAGKALREIKLSPDWVVAAIQRAHQVHVPGADDIVRAGDTLLVIGRHGQERKLRKLFGAGG